MVENTRKLCFKCKQIKSLTDFYRHFRMADGHLNKCKECTKNDVKIHYEAIGGNVEYERARAKTPERKAAQKRYWKERAKRDPIRVQAQAKLSRAIRTGRLKKEPCEICGTTEKIQGHHEDYNKPLEVRWLCFKHHREHGHGQTVRG
jgi:hypothetical protein